MEVKRGGKRVGLEARRGGKSVGCRKVGGYGIGVQMGR